MPLRIELIGSPYGNTPKNRATVAALGLRKLHSTVIQEDNPTIRGMIRKVAHLLKVEVVEAAPVEAAAAPVAEPAAEAEAPKPKRKPKAKATGE